MANVPKCEGCIANYPRKESKEEPGVFYHYRLYKTDGPRGLVFKCTAFTDEMMKDDDYVERQLIDYLVENDGEDSIEMLVKGIMRIVAAPPDTYANWSAWFVKDHEWREAISEYTIDQQAVIHLMLKQCWDDATKAAKMSTSHESIRGTI
jgi:hypothetical protein